MIVGSATPIGTSRMWNAKVKPICDRAGVNCTGPDARAIQVDVTEPALAGRRRSRTGRGGSAQTAEEVVADAERIRHRSQRRVDGADAWKHARIDDVEVVQ